MMIYNLALAHLLSVMPRDDAHLRYDIEKSHRYMALERSKDLDQDQNGGQMLLSDESAVPATDATLNYDLVDGTFEFGGIPSKACNPSVSSGRHSDQYLQDY